MSAPAKSGKGKAAAVAKAKAAMSASSWSAAPAASKKAVAPNKKKAQKKMRDEEDDDDDDSSSDGADSDAEIEMTATGNVKATMKPVPESAPLPTVEGISNAIAASKKQQQKQGNNSKKRKAEDDADDDDGEGEDTADPNELIDVEFGLYDPKPIDYLSVKMLLRDYLPAPPAKKKKKSKGDESAASAPGAEDFPVHELTDAIVDQVAVGSTIKGEGTDEPLGFLSLINPYWQSMNTRDQDGKPIKWVQHLRKYLLNRSPDADSKKWVPALQSEKLGLLIQNRLINVPPQIVPQMHQSLLDDMDWVVKTAPQYGQQFADIDQVLLIARKFKPAPGSKKSVRQDVLPEAQFVSPFASRKKQKKSQSAAAAASEESSEEFEWLRFEEELYFRASTAHFSFDCPFTEEDASAGRQPQKCVVMLVPFSKLRGIVQELHAMASS